MNPGYSTGATFVPGGDDSYYMPELIAPAPQRVLSELPGNFEDTLIPKGPASNRANRPQPPPNPLPYLNLPSPTGQPETTNNQSIPYGNNTIRNPTSLQDRYGSSSAAPLYEQPNFTPFPVLQNPPSTVPPTDEQREALLEAARASVLASNDPETQLLWAQDALTYVDIALQNEARISATQPARSRTPRIEHVLREDAMKVVEFLADQHHPTAEFLRGTWLEFGKFGNRIDKKEAFHCYTRAAEKGYARADYRIGMQFESSNDALKAIKYYQRGADAGDSASCYRLGMMTLLGQHGQVQDFEKGLNMIYLSSQTADENAPQGAYVFGMLQARQLAQVSIPDRFLPLDIANAKVNIERAAFLGFGKAQVKMGSAYELCELGCEFNPALSLHYNALAARQGEADAEMAISKWFLCGQEGVFEKNEEMAFTYAQRAAVSGMATAQFALGYFYEVGIYVPVSFRDAQEWYGKAAASGNKDASTRVDCISRSKTLSRKDHERVALPKIRERQGARGRQPTPLAALPENEPPATIDMPDPSRMRLTPKPYLPNRPTSTAPYPTDEEPPRLGQPNHQSNYINPEQRPTSAFGINPNLRPNSAQAPYRRPDPYGPPGPQQGLPPQNRYYSNVETGGPGYGRGDQMPYAPGPGAGFVPQGRGQSRPGSASPYLQPPKPPTLANPQNLQSGPPPRPSKINPTKANPAKVDIGFSAPLDASGADRPQRSPTGYDPYAHKPQPQPPLPTTNNPARRPSPGPTANQAPPPSNRYYANRPAENSRPPPSNIKPARITPSKAPIAPSTLPAPTKPTKVSASTQSSVPSGPQTFEDMGVPSGKNNSECVIM